MAAVQVKAFNKTERKHYLDNIRWGTVVLVLIYHVFYLYNTVGVPFPIAKDAGIRAFDTFSYLVYPWFMVILFLIAGISARYALKNRTNREFLKDKVTKFLVPSTLGLFVYHWISGYLNVKLGGGLASIPSFIRYPVFVISGIGPLWFIQMLFLFSDAWCCLKRSISKTGYGHFILHSPRSMVPLPRSVIPTARSVVPPTCFVIPSARSVVPSTRFVIPTARSVVPPTCFVIPPARSMISSDGSFIPVLNFIRYPLGLGVRFIDLLILTANSITI